MVAHARISQTHAAARLDVSTRALRQWIAMGYFTAIYPHGKGLGRPCYLLAHEVDAAVLDWTTAVRRGEVKLYRSRRRA